MRTARSRTSGENFVDFLMDPSSQRLEPPQNPGRFNGVKLNNQLTSQAITGGHAFGKHIDEFSDLGIATEKQFQSHVENVINNATNKGSLSNGRTYFYDSNSNTVVIKNPNAVDGGTAFRIDTTRYPNPLDYIKTLR